jgi:predicted amidohydrolase YtcJ
MQQFREKQWKAYTDFANNLKTLHEAGLEPGFTSLNMKWKDFSNTLETLMEFGLSEELLIQTMTENTAKVLGLDSKIGKLEKGYTANFTVTTKSMFEKKNKQLYQVIKGELNDVQ